jgi:hypothetical protein
MVFGFFCSVPNLLKFRVVSCHHTAIASAPLIEGSWLKSPYIQSYLTEVPAQVHLRKLII